MADGASDALDLTGDGLRLDVEHFGIDAIQLASDPAALYAGELLEGFNLNEPPSMLG